MKSTVSDQAARTYKIASVLLQYPTQELFAGLDVLDEACRQTGRKSRPAFAAHLQWLRATDPEEIVDQYVQTFDLKRRTALYLTYFRFGDTRKRGMAMLAFKTAYRRAGFEPTEDELPDYLPLVLDFSALNSLGQDLLVRHRGDLEVLRRGLEKRESPYMHVIEAVQAQLPGLGRREIAQVTKAWRDGPPKEDVGLEPFAPPEYIEGARR